jgi:hypothetical protein
LLFLSLADDYLPFGLGGLFPLPPPDCLPVVLGALTGLLVFAIMKIVKHKSYSLGFSVTPNLLIINLKIAPIFNPIIIPKLIMQSPLFLSNLPTTSYLRNKLTTFVNIISSFTRLLMNNLDFYSVTNITILFEKCKHFG